MSFLRRHLIAVFVVGILLIPVLLAWLTQSGYLRSTFFEFAFLSMPVLAFALAWATEGRAGVMDMVDSALTWRAHWAYYVVAVLIFPAMGLTAVFAYQLLWGKLGDPILVDWYDLTHMTPWMLTVMVLISVSDEIAWFSFTLTRVMRTRTNAFAASLVIGFLWFVSYLPRYFLSEMVADRSIPIPLFCLNFVTMAPICAWLYQSTKSGVVILLMQVVGNYTFLTLPMLPQATGHPYLFLMKVVVMGAVSVGLLLRYGPALRPR